MFVRRLRPGRQRRRVCPKATGDLVGVGEADRISSVNGSMVGETFVLPIAGPDWFLGEAGVTRTLGGSRRKFRRWDAETGRTRDGTARSSPIEPTRSPPAWLRRFSRLSLHSPP
jgi:hypothetical protein